MAPWSDTLLRHMGSVVLLSFVTSDLRASHGQTARSLLLADAFIPLAIAVDPEHIVLLFAVWLTLRLPSLLLARGTMERKCNRLWCIDNPILHDHFGLGCRSVLGDCLRHDGVLPNDRYYL